MPGRWALFLRMLPALPRLAKFKPDSRLTVADVIERRARIANSAAPGMPISQGSKNIKPLASETMRPQLGAGGCTPKPRKESAASSSTAWATSMVATTIRLLTMFGMISESRMRPVEQPSALAAAT